MKWLNLEIKDLISHEYLGSEPIDRATWINLLRYCCQQENNGIIKECTEWGDRKWMQLVGVTKQEVIKNSMLWEVKNSDVVVWHYPSEQQKVIKAKRLAGKKYGKGHPKDSVSSPNSSPISSAKGNSNSKRKSNDIPSLEEFLNYCNNDLKDYQLDGENIYKGYLENEWKDSHNNPIKNWKQKLRQVWCKPEKKKKVVPSNWSSSII